MSHLNDAIIDHTINSEQCVLRIRFLTWLIAKFTDTSIEIDPDEEFKEFLKSI